MRRILAIGTLLSALCAFPAFAILDTNNNGLSDLWERAYNGGDLFPIDVFPYRPGDDSDGDGWTNEQEAAADTNPFDPNPPDGLIRPDIVHIPEVLGETPEAVTLTWPTIVGKQYTLLYSPDLVEWLSVPDETFIGNGSVVSYNYTLDENTKLFWRVKIEDVDADGDGLTDAEEYELGTDPNNPETLTGYPDMWVAKHYTAALLNGALATLDLNGDPDGDGLINAQESVLGTDPNVADNPGILQEAISNGDFSNPVIGTGVRAATTNPTWDYWEGGVSGWTAVVGSNIEFQTVEPDDASSGDYPYVELKAHPAGHYGIKQQVGTHIGTTYLLVFDCKARLNTTPSNNNFTVNINSSVVKDITFDTIAPWTTKAVVFKATNCMTEISMVPTNSLDDTKGCFVDNVKLAPVEIEQQGYTPTGGIKFCRWLDAFQGGNFDNDFADNDRDHFRIRIPQIIPNLTKIKIKSTGLHGAVIDGAIVEKTTDGDYEVEMKQENGTMVSTWILLVSDGDDDKYYNGKGTDNEKDDQTLLADFKSKILVTFPEIDNTEVEFTAQKPLGNITLDTVYLSPTGDVPQNMQDLIHRQVAKMQEIYRQIGVRVAWASIQGVAIPQSWIDAVPNPDPTKPDIEPANQLNASECQSARVLVRNRQVPAKHIRIGYVDAVMLPDPLFPARTALGFTDLGTDGIVVSLGSQQAQRTLGVTAHEVGHTLGLDHVDPSDFLMKSPLRWENGRRDSKRFEEGNFNTIKNKEAFYVPIQ